MKTIVNWVLPVIGIIIFAPVEVFAIVFSCRCWLFINDEMFGGFFFLYAAIATFCALVGGFILFLCIRKVVRMIKNNRTSPN